MAAEKVKVTYTNVQRPLLDIREAIQVQSFYTGVTPEPIVVGDPDREYFS